MNIPQLSTELIKKLEVIYPPLRISRKDDPMDVHWKAAQREVVQKLVDFGSSYNA